jgi:23S rRNA (adenine2030-N6)-methyltransferase
MLSYRHGFHAGNSADVFKHMVLIFCLDYLAQKEKPYLCIDTHAGAGVYPLFEGFAAKNCEWEQGIAKLPGAARLHGRLNGSGGLDDGDLVGDREQVPAMLDRYLEVTGLGGLINHAAIHTPGAAAQPALFYPGSPEITRRLLRKGDKACCFELHPEDFAALTLLLGSDRRFTLRREDGFAGLTGLLPPLSRRGLIFIDPPYEVKEDYTLLPQALCDALERFPTGIYIIWYPLLHKDPRPASAGTVTFGETVSFQETLLNLYGGNRLGIEFYTAPKDPANSPRGMYGSGLVVFNPPWTLKAALEESLPFLGETMGIGSGGWKMHYR